MELCAYEVSQNMWHLCVSTFLWTQHGGFGHGNTLLFLSLVGKAQSRHVLHERQMIPFVLRMRQWEHTDNRWSINSQEVGRFGFVRLLRDGKEIPAVVAAMLNIRAPGVPHLLLTQRADLCRDGGFRDSNQRVREHALFTSVLHPDELPEMLKLLDEVTLCKRLANWSCGWGSIPIRLLFGGFASVRSQRVTGKLLTHR